MSKDLDQLDSILGNPLQVRVTYRSPTTGVPEEAVVEVAEVTMMNFKAFAAACSPFFREFDEAGRLATRVDTNTGDTIPPEDFALFHVLADYSDAFMTAAALVSNKPVSFYQRLSPDQFFEVAAAVIKVNGDFFVRSLAPSLLRMARVLGTIGTTTSTT